MTLPADPYRPSKVSPSLSPASLRLRLVLTLGGVLIATVLLGKVLAVASPDLQKKLSADIANEDRCATGQCSTGLSPIGLPESCLLREHATLPAAK